MPNYLYQYSYFCSDFEMCSTNEILSKLYQAEVCKEKRDQFSILLSTWAAKKLEVLFENSNIMAEYL